MDRSGVFSVFSGLGRFRLLAHTYTLSSISCVLLCTAVYLVQPREGLHGPVSPQSRDSQIQDILGSPQEDC